MKTHTGLTPLSRSCFSALSVLARKDKDVSPERYEELKTSAAGLSR